MSFKNDLWDGATGEPKVNIESETAGYWFHGC